MTCAAPSNRPRPRARTPTRTPSSRPIRPRLEPGRGGRGGPGLAASPVRPRPHPPRRERAGRPDRADDGLPRAVRLPAHRLRPGRGLLRAGHATRLAPARELAHAGARRGPDRDRQDRRSPVRRPRGRANPIHSARSRRMGVEPARTWNVFNALPEDEARARLRSCLAAPRWVEDVLSGRPYRDAESLWGRAEEGPATSTTPNWTGPAPAPAHRRASLRGRARGGVLAAGASRGRRLRPDVAAAWPRATVANQQRFDRVFLIRAAGRSAPDIPRSSSVGSATTTRPSAKIRPAAEGDRHAPTEAGGLSGDPEHTRARHESRPPGRGGERPAFRMSSPEPSSPELSSAPCPSGRA